MIGTKEYQKKFGATKIQTEPKNREANISKVASMKTNLEAELLLEQFSGIIAQLQLNVI